MERRHRSGMVRGTILLAACLASVGLACAPGAATDPEVVYEQALFALEQGRFDEAEAGLERLAGLRPPTVLDWGVRARVAMARDRPDEALAALAQIPDDHPLAAWARMRSGQLKSRRDLFRQAEGHLRRALELEPGLIEARRALIYILGLQLRRQELAEQFETLARQATLNAREVWVWCMVRDLAWWTPDEHSPILERALRADPEDKWSRLALAENYRRTGRYPEAEAQLAALPATDPEALAARAGIALELRGQDEAADLLAQGPVDHPALAGLRGRLALGRGDAAEAVRQYEIAHRAEPDRRKTLADLGRAWSVAGDPEKGKGYLDQAARIDALDNLLLQSEFRTEGSDPGLWRSLAAACESAGRTLEARAWYTLLVALDPLDSEAQRALFRLRPAGGPP